jgi:hypothetical protein
MPLGTATLGAATAVCGADPWGFSAVDALAALGDGVANRHRDQALAQRGVILAHPVPQVRSPNAFTNRRLLWLKLAQSAAIGCGFDRGFAAARQRYWRRVHNSMGLTAKGGRNVHLGEHRARPDETVG